MKVAVLGCGRWGSFQAWYADQIGHKVLVWGREGSDKYNKLSDTRRNEYLTLSAGVGFTTSLERAVAFADVIIISVNSQALRGMARQLAEIKTAGKAFVLCMKGLEIGSGKRLTQVMADELGSETAVAVWVGPGHVQDFLRDIPNCMVIGASDTALVDRLIKSFGSNLIRFYYGDDLIGIEIGAAAKNVIGIAAGMLDGMNYGSLKGALMARGTKELSRLVAAMGGRPMTVYGLSHLGDYEATLFSPHSNNRRFGEDFVKGRRFGKLAEGVSTVWALTSLGRCHGVELPICQAIYDIVIDGKNPKQVLLDLFLRPLKVE